MIEKKKVAVLTTYFANFGSYFQATSLQRQVEKLGYECELINERARLFKSYKMLISVCLTPVLPRFAKEFIAARVPQYYAFLRLKNDVAKLKVSPAFSFNLKKLSKNYDCIVVGSDELWSANKKTIVYYPFYFGIGLESPHITYGPSATMFEGASDQRLAKMQEGLASFRKISVRDTFTKDFIKKLLGIEPPLVIDPTLMNPYFAKNGRGNGGYVLVYGQHYSEKEKKVIKDFAKSHKWKVMAAAWRHDSWCDGFIDTHSADDMQDAFQRSEYCFPSTFHGVIFSVLNHRNFVTFINPLRGRKVSMLLETLQLKDRIYSDKKINQFTDVDYGTVDKLLEGLREKSIDYLQKALEEACNEET